MAINYVQLKAEIENDPQTYGYAAFLAAGEPENIAAALNKLRDGTDGEAAVSVRRTDITPVELLEALDTRDISNSTNTLVGAYLQALLVQPTIRLTNANGNANRIKDNLDRIITNGQNSQTRFNALAVRVGSRAEQLFGAGTVISTADVGQALNPPAFKA